MGQDKPVVVYRLCSKNTIDEQILKHTSAKRKLEKILIGNGKIVINIFYLFSEKFCCIIV